MKCLVTGGAGFIGSNLVDRLIKEGHQVIVVDNESSDANEKFYWNEKAENHKLDVCVYEDIYDLFNGVDVVFHLAAEARIQPSIENPRQAVYSNVVGTFNILEASRHQGVKRVVYSSTSSAYGLKNNPPLKEEMKKDCLNPYSVTKTCGEEMALMYSSLYDLETVVFRYFNVYGNRQPIKGQYAPVVGIFLRQMRQNKPLTIVGDGTQRRDFTHVDDIVEGLILTSQSDNFELDIVELGRGNNHSINELAAMFDKETEYIEARPGEARETLCDISVAKRDIGYEPKVNIEDYVKEVISGDIE